MGVSYAVKDDDLDKVYVYARDFSTLLSPADETSFTYERFEEALGTRKQNLKTVLVGKDAVVVGLSNSAFQDIIYQAGLYPKRRISELSNDGKRALYDAIKWVIQERIRQGGRAISGSVWKPRTPFSLNELESER